MSWPCAPAEGVLLGGNHFSGNTRAIPAVGAPIIGYGNGHVRIHQQDGVFQQRGHFKGRITAIEGNIIYYTGDAPFSGDSGGPVWIPCKGFIGVTARANHGTAAGQPLNGDIVSLDALIQHRPQTAVLGAGQADPGDFWRSGCNPDAHLAQIPANRSSETGEYPSPASPPLSPGSRLIPEPPAPPEPGTVPGPAPERLGAGTIVGIVVAALVALGALLGGAWAALARMF